MDKRELYLREIAARGNRYGDEGGLNSLLNWCGKYNVRQVTEAEAKLFLDDPRAEYKDTETKK